LYVKGSNVLECGEMLKETVGLCLGVTDRWMSCGNDNTTSYG